MKDAIRKFSFVVLRFNADGDLLDVDITVPMEIVIGLMRFLFMQFIICGCYSEVPETVKSRDVVIVEMGV